MGLHLMADKPIPKNWLVDPTNEVRVKWAQVERQQKVSQLNKTRQDIDDLKKGQILGLEATCDMLELEIKRLDAELMKLRSIEVQNDAK